MISPDVLKQIRRVQIRARRAVQSLVGGEYHSAFKGSGLSFEDVREYQPGDDVRRIDWNVTARSGRPYLKRFIEERELTILLAVDLSGSLSFGSTATTKRAVAADIAALLALAAISNGDRVGLLAFTDRIERYLPPGKGHHQAMRLLRDLLTFEPIGKKTDLAAACREMVQIQRRRCIVFLLSDFQGEGYESAFRRAARQHDLVAVRIADPLDEAIPDVGYLRVQDPETGRRLLVSSRAANEESDPKRLSSFAARESFSRLVRGSGADIIEASTQGGHIDAVADFLKRRERRR